MTPGPTIDLEVERALQPRKSKRRHDELDFLCIAHEESTASASWNRKKGTWHCLAGACGASGDTADLARRLGIHVETPKERAEKGTVVATYDYCDEDGDVRYRVVRFQPKSFQQHQPDGRGGWITDIKGIEPLPYRLPELLGSEGRVFILGGEKDVDNALDVGLNATCNSGGENPVNWRQSFNRYLADREVVVIPDRDKSGDRYAPAVAQSLLGIASVVKVLILPRLKWREKGGPDLSDWLLEGGTAEELHDLAEGCRAWQAPQEPTSTVSFAETDAGNAELFAHLFGDRVRYDWMKDRWLVWVEHRWIPEATGELIRLAIECARARARSAASLEGERAKAAFGFAKASENHGKIEAMLKIARALPPIADNGLGWDAHPMLLGFENGIMNLVTGDLRPGRREDRVTKTTGLVYDADATCPVWERCLEDWQPDTQVREYLRLISGYSYTGSTKEQVWFLLYGRGANGKGTLIDVLRWSAGEYGHNMAFSSIEKGKEQSISSDMAALAGKRVVTTSETDKSTRFNEARLKSLTGEDPVTARELYKKEFTFDPELKLFVAVNDKPVMRDDSEGNWRRVRLIPFLVTFPVETRDNDLRAKLKAELAGIAAWRVRAAVDWNKHRLPIPPAVAVATVAYRAEEDPFGEFITDCCVLRDQVTVKADLLYKGYKGWAEARSYGVRETLTATMFGRLMGDRFEKKTVHGVRQYQGIGLLSEYPEDDWSPNPSTQVEGSEAGEGLYRTSPRNSPTRSGELLEKLSTNPLPSTNQSEAAECTCEGCPEDATEGCDGSPFVLDDAGEPHCRAHCAVTQ